MNYKLSRKNEQGKWWSWGNVKENQWGNLQASFKVTPELIKLFQENEGKWINFSMFDEKKPSIDKHNKDKANAYQSEIEDELLF